MTEHRKHTKRAILLVDHGSRRAAANENLNHVAALVRERAPADIEYVAAAHMELASPTIADGLAECVDAGAGEVIVMPYLLAAGRHATEDIPRMAREAAEAHPGLSVRVTAPLGVHGLLADLVLERVADQRG